MSTKTRPSTLIAALFGLVVAGSAQSQLLQRQHILVVGSSTAYPIVAAAAERFGRDHTSAAPVVESTGTGGGIKLFCAGIGLETPDIVMASRRMKDSEHTDCSNNQVRDIREIKIGYDGIVIANSKRGPRLSLSKNDLYQALARDVPAADGSGALVPNPYTTWREVNPELPDLAIRVLGPPPTSGTRDILVEHLFQEACLAVPSLRDLQHSDLPLFKQRCYALREDGAFVNAGENDARLVRKLINDDSAIGIFGFSFLDRNRNALQGATVDGIEPRFELIESGIYPLSRPLFLYVKPRHSRIVGGLDEFVDELTSDAASGADGYLVEQGLIPLPSGD